MIRRASFLLALLALPLTAAAYMYMRAISQPVVRRASIAMSDWPAGTPPMHIALLSDIHLAGPDMPPSRLSQIVEQVNALKPDLVVLAGDFVSDKRVATKAYSAADGLKALARLRARHGAWAVLGNHDHWRNEAEISRGLRNANVRILENEAVTLGGIRLGGVGDYYTGNANLRMTARAMRSGRGSKVLLSHSPDVAAQMPRDITLLLAGHTHCGQIRLPLVGAISYASDYGDRYACGLINERGRRIVITAGIGTSVLPLRLRTPPDLWLLTLGPAKTTSR